MKGNYPSSHKVLLTIFQRLDYQAFILTFLITNVCLDYNVSYKNYSLWSDFDTKNSGQILYKNSVYGMFMFTRECRASVVIFHFQCQKRATLAKHTG